MSQTYDFSKLEELNGYHTDLSDVITHLVILGLGIYPLNPETLSPYEWVVLDTPEKAQAYKEKFPDALPGIATGRDILAIEVPAKKVDLFCDFCFRHGFSPDTTTVITSRIRNTYLFANPDHLDIPPRETISGITLCGQNGITVGAPAISRDGTIWEIENAGLQPFPSTLISSLKMEVFSLYEKSTCLENQLMTQLAIPEHTCQTRTSFFLKKEAPTWSKEIVESLQTPVDLALFYASLGIPVVPCDENTKHPLTKKGEYNDETWGATTNPEHIKKIFENYPTAMVAGVMGEKSGLLAIDCDVKNKIDGNSAFLNICTQNDFNPESTLTIETPSGGKHYIFKYPAQEDIRKKTNYPEAGIDIQANGGLLILAGSKRGQNCTYAGKCYRIVNDVKPLESPSFLVDLLRKKESPASHVVQNQTSYIKSKSISTVEGMKVLEDAVNKMTNCPEGSRNETLNNVCFYCGLHIRDGLLKESVAHESLIRAALISGLPESEANYTVTRSLREGKESTKQIKRRSSARLSKVLSHSSIANTDHSHYHEVISAVGNNAYIPGVISKYALRDNITDMFELARRILPKKMFNLVVKYSETNQIPIETVIPVMIALISASIGGRRRIIVDEDSSYEVGANLYQILIGDSRSGKSRLTKFFFSPLFRKEEEYKIQYLKELNEYNEKIEYWKQKGGSKPEKPIRKELIIDDATMEAALTSHANNPCGLFWPVDEGHSWFRSLSRYNKDGAADTKNKLIRAWDCGYVKINRQRKDGEDRSYSIAHAFFIIFINIQPPLLSRFFDTDDWNQGSAQRFLYINLPPKRPGTLLEKTRNKNINEGNAQRYLDEIADRLIALGGRDMNSIGKALSIDDEAFEFAQKESHRMELNLCHGNLTTSIARLDDMIPRFALILHYLHWADSDECDRINPDTSINKQDFERAFDLARIYLLHLDKTLWLMNKDRGFPTKHLSTSQLKIAKFVLENPDFFIEYHTVEEMESIGLPIPDDMDRQKFGIWLKKQGFKNKKRKGHPAKHLLAGLEPWKDAIELQRPSFDIEDPDAPYIDSLTVHAEEIVMRNGVIDEKTMASWLDSDPYSLSLDEDFDLAMVHLGVEKRDGKFIIPANLYKNGHVESSPN